MSNVVKNVVRGILVPFKESLTFISGAGAKFPNLYGTHYKYVYGNDYAGPFRSCRDVPLAINVFDAYRALYPRVF